MDVLAHRGGAGNFPENSLAAFAAAVQAGADGVELDVRRSADGVAVVHHDPVVPGVGPVHATPAAALPEHVPSLEAALAACAGAVVDVEVKGAPGDPGYDPDEVLAGEVAAALRALPAPPDGPRAVLLTSFWPPTLAAAKAGAPELATGLLVHPAFEVLDALAQARAIGCSTLLPFRSQVTPELVRAVHAAGMGVVAWTVNEPADVRAMAAAGVDALVTDRVADALEALGRG